MSDNIPVLDHGYVKLIESWGSDERIIEAARMSTNKGFQGWGHDTYSCRLCNYEVKLNRGVNNDNFQANCPRDQSVLFIKDCQSGDEKLLYYLYSHKHSTPFEMAGLIIEVQAPIFVFREWHRHRTQSYNEMSARYTPLPNVNYLPNFDRIASGAKEKANKQASSVSDFNADKICDWLDELESTYIKLEELYQFGLKYGVPKEVSRICLPVARYSKMRASANLRNWLAFLTLRMDQAAQWEIRQYANVVGSIISELFPRTWQLFIEGKEREVKNA